jgi:hypothetical protein
MDDQIDIRLIAIESQLNALDEEFRDYKHKMETKLERIDDILVVHRNQTDNQRKNFHQLRKVLDDKVMDLLEKGEHGEE